MKAQATNLCTVIAFLIRFLHKCAVYVWYIDDLKKTRPMDKIMYLIELLDDECNFYTCQAVVIRLRDMVCEWVS